MFSGLWQLVAYWWPLYGRLNVLVFLSYKLFVFIVWVVSFIVSFRNGLLTVVKPKPKQLLRPITAGTDKTMGQSELEAACSRAKRGKTRTRGFGFTSY